MNTEKNFTSAQTALFALMKSISTDSFKSHWNDGLEYALWAALNEGEESVGASEITTDKLALLRQRADEAGGWIIWRDDQTNPGLTADKWGAYFVTTDEWLAIIASVPENLPR